MLESIPPQHPDLESYLHRIFGYGEFRPGQRALIEAVMDGKDALGVMPTGGGKSLCFQLPAVLREGTALIISPLIALMKDQVDALRARGIAAEAYNSTLSVGERREILDRLRQGQVKVLYMAPERISAEGFMDTLSRVPLSLLAIDEAHCISHWGHDFRPEYRRLGELRRWIRGPDPSKPVPVIALTATATQRVQEDILERMGIQDAVKVITGFRRTNLSFEVRNSPSRADKFRVACDLIRASIGEGTAGGSAIIYCATRKNVERVSEELRDCLDDFEVGFYHAGLSDGERTDVQERFLNGGVRVLVAMNAFGMGIDKPDVRLVIHFDIPGSVEAYYQEAGRAGRDGKHARCVLLFNYADVATQEFFITKSAQESYSSGPIFDDADSYGGPTGGFAGNRDIESQVETQRALLKQLVRYAYATSCRQQLILGYFGDAELAPGEGCGQCDRCKPDQREWEQADEFTAIAARQALSAVARLNNRFGKARIAELLKGSETAAIVAAGLQDQTTYGMLESWSIAEIRDLMERLLEAGYLRISGLDYPVLGITTEGVQVMKGEVPVKLPRQAAEAATGGRSRKGKRGGSRKSGGSAPSPRAGEGEGEGGGGGPGLTVDSRLLDELRDFRRQEAKEKGMPAYVIFHDKTLQEIASMRPKTLHELERVPGMGPKKLELYGPKLLAILNPGA